MSSANNYPRVLLLTDATFSGEARGLDRTLKNLFSAYPTDHLFILAPEEELKAHLPDPKWSSRVHSVRTQKLRSLRNRLGAFFEPLRKSLNIALLRREAAARLTDVRPFRPEVVIVCTSGIEMTALSRHIIDGLKIPALYYGMDDLRDLENIRWLSGSGRETLTSLLDRSSGWAFISEELARTYRNRYALKNTKPTLIVHNPVDVKAENNPARLAERTGPFRLVYAGSIWGMHFDALLTLAQAVTSLRKEGKEIELVIYTAEEFRKRYGAALEAPGVRFGGFVPYELLDAKLQEADLLVLASSFLPENEHLSRTSVQTKLTDYLAAGRAILCIGPLYAACNCLLKQFQCAAFIETNEPNAVKELLRAEISRRPEHRKLADRGYAVVQEKFELKQVQKELYGFLNEICR